MAWPGFPRAGHGLAWGVEPENTGGKPKCEKACTWEKTVGLRHDIVDPPQESERWICELNHVERVLLPTRCHQPGREQDATTGRPRRTPSRGARGGARTAACSSCRNSPATEGDGQTEDQGQGDDELEGDVWIDETMRDGQQRPEDEPDPKAPKVRIWTSARAEPMSGSHHHHDEHIVHHIHLPRG